MRLLSFAFIAFLFSATLAARADTVYTYTGKDFTLAESPFTTSDSVTGSFTLAAPLGDNLSFDDVNPLSFSFSDGVQTFNSSNTASEFFQFSTDSNGQLTAYSINLPDGPADISIINFPGAYAGDSAIDAQGDAALNYRAGSFTATTSVSATPEPSGLALLGTGALGLACVVKRPGGLFLLGKPRPERCR